MNEINILFLILYFHVCAFQECTKELKLQNMVFLSMDGPNVNGKFVELIQKEHGEQYDGTPLQIVGSCGLHTLHNSFNSGFAVWHIEKILRALHSLSARREDFSSATNSSTFPLPFCGRAKEKKEEMLVIDNDIEKKSA